MGHAGVQAPAENRAILAVPDLDQAPAMLERNRARLEQWRHEFQGLTAAQVRAMTRAALLAASREYSAYEDGGAEPAPDPTQPLIVTGHQPSLFHPGVWIKNFAAHFLARRCAGTAVHLIVDNDTVKSTAVRVPTGTASSPCVRSLLLDRWQGQVPFEEYVVSDVEQFGSFGRRLTEVVGSLGLRPLATEYWPLVLAARRPWKLGAVLAAARHRLERRWGCRTFSLPLSHLCQTDGFLWFACHLLAHLERFQLAHNRSLAAYRRRHGIRSRRHPVPPLERQGEWLEAPFWVWSQQRPRRRQLFVALGGRIMTLTDRAGWRLQLPLHPDADARQAVEMLLRGQTDDGFKLRTRALTTTLFARLCFADLFIHGLGGARYDELSDELMRQFFGLDPPGFITLTATLHLPLAPHPATVEQRRGLERRLRDLTYNPQRYLDLEQEPNNPWAQFVKEKRNLIRQQPTSRRQRRDRYLAFRRVNQALAPAVQPQRERTAVELDRVRAALRANALLQNREWPFCVYPAETLRGFYQPFLSAR